jgi:hypothetical protein
MEMERRRGSSYGANLSKNVTKTPTSTSKVGMVVCVYNPCSLKARAGDRSPRLAPGKKVKPYLKNN